MTAEELLKLCHAYLRGVVINEPGGCAPIDPDQLARQINLYLNDLWNVQPVSKTPES